MTMTSPSFWHRLDRVLARIRPHRQPLSLLIDGAVIALCWNFTYLFRLGFERWLNARPRYDLGVMVCVVAVYLLVFAAARIPRGMWRFSGFGEVKRLTVACFIAGLVSAAMNVAAGIGGPAVALYADNAGWPHERTRSTLKVYFLALNLVGLASLGLPELPAGQLLAAAAALAVGLVLGHAAGGRVTATTARRTTLSLAAGGGLLVLVSALSG